LLRVLRWQMLMDWGLLLLLLQLLRVDRKLLLRYLLMVLLLNLL